MASSKKNANRASDSSRKREKRKGGNWWKWFLGSAAVMIIGAIAGFMLIIFAGEMIVNNNLSKMEMSEASIIYDRNDKEVTKLYLENREMVTLEDVPDLLEQAFIAVEDRRFEEHIGVDLWAIGRALYKDIVHRDIVEGGSTITQQLARNFFLSREQTLFRKVLEASIAIALEKRFTKEQILEMYMNRIFFGHNAYGVKAAAEVYFGKENLHDLTIAEMATLVGIPKGPSVYNPISDPERAKERRAVVLQVMYEQGLISKEEMEQAKEEPFPEMKRSKNQYIQSYIDYVLEEAKEVTGLSEEELRRGGYQIYTTMDSKAQEIMGEAFSNDSLFPKPGPKKKPEAAMVILDHSDGGIIAMMGGRNYAPRGTNRVFVPQQPGSAFKPIAVYAPALETGDWYPYSQLKDEQIKFGNYQPSNWDDRYRGWVSMVDAIKYSINVPAVWLLNEIGVDEGVRFSKNIGIPLLDEDRNLAIALGGLTEGATPMQMAAAYSAFANEGVWSKPYAIRQIIDRDGTVVYEHTVEQKRVMEAKTAYWMTRMLEKVLERGGTGVNARINRPVAGKTGSTQVPYEGVPQKGTNKDVWFVGYTPEWTAAIWMGYDKPDKEHYLNVSSGLPAKLFARVMEKALQGRKVVDFQRPEGVPEMPRPPAAVNDLEATYLFMENEVVLHWSPVKEGMHYRLYRKEASASEFELLAETENTVVRDVSVVPGKEYEYYVVTIDPNTRLESGKSNTAKVETKLFDPDDDSWPFPGLDPDQDPDSDWDDESGGDDSRRDDDSGRNDGRNDGGRKNGSGRNNGSGRDPGSDFNPGPGPRQPDFPDGDLPNQPDDRFQNGPPSDVGESVIPEDFEFWR